MTLKPFGFLPLFLIIPTLGIATVGGTVESTAGGNPISGVAITVEASGKSFILPNMTDSLGHFSFDPATTFTEDERNTIGLNLYLSKKDFRAATYVIRFSEPGLSSHKERSFTMERITGDTAIDSSAKQAIQASKSVDGRSLFFVPYEFDPSDTDPELKRFNRTFTFHLKRGINTHLQSLEMDVTPSDIGVVDMPINIGTGNTERVRAYGVALNALGVVSLDMLQADDTQSLAVVSGYVVIPSGPDAPLNTLYVDDYFKAGELHSTRLFERLNDLWGINTVLALSLRNIQAYLSDNDDNHLQVARQYLMAEKKLAGPNSGRLVRDIDKLVNWIDERLDQ